MLDQYRSTLGTVVGQYPVLGLALTHHQSTRGTALELRNKPYLVEIYADCTEAVDWRFMKAVQTGISEWAIQFALERSGWSGRVVAYVLQTYGVRDRFVQSRVNPLLERIPAYRERCPGGGLFQSTDKGGQNLKVKKFGRGAMLYLGSNAVGDFVEFSADVLIVDEYDHCDQTNLAKARNRLRESPYPQKVRIGNPTLPGIGISKLYDESDRRRWWFICQHCNHRQPVDWFENVVRRADGGQWTPRDEGRARTLRAGAKCTPHNDIRPFCSRCKKPFEREAKGACWVAHSPGGTVRGYRMSRMDVLTDMLWPLFAEWLEAQGDPVKLASFFQDVLGIPFEYDGTKLTVELLDAAATGTPMDWSGGEGYAKQTVTCGVDVGAVLNTSISVIEGRKDEDGNWLEPLRRSVFLGAFRTFDELYDVLIRYHVDLCVIDSMPETRKVMELRDRCINEGGPVTWLCRFYPTAKVGAQKYGMKPDYRASVVQVDRTAVFDQSFEDIRSVNRTFPEDVFMVLGWSEQMRAPVRVHDAKKGRIVWFEGTRPDHYRLADVYDRVAYDMLAMGGSYSVV